MKTSKILTGLALTATALSISTASLANERTTGRDAPGSPVIYVESQGLYYDSIALGDLPIKGDFQRLYPSMYGLTTDFGPGDVGHRGGRWWIDMNQDGVMDEGDKYFLCPLLGPGRTMP